MERRSNTRYTLDMHSIGLGLQLLPLDLFKQSCTQLFLQVYMHNHLHTGQTQGKVQPMR